MDTGIKGRTTSKYLHKLAKDRNVAAVVLRVDSPGGDPLPSDLVAEGIRKLKAAGKPVIISQGDVAASGGYWISMDGNRILTTPLTITGSIGVIGGWLWDDGLGEKLGLTADEVHRGDHADLFAGMGIPFVGGAIPRRPLNEEELDKVEDLIVGMYGDFVQKVATGRGLEEARVRELGEGRVWMGGDALERGLVDSFGSLPDAIALAREMAGLDPDRPVNVAEFPERPLFEWPSFGPRMAGVSGVATPLLAPVAKLLHDLKPGSDWADIDTGDGEEVNYEAFYLSTLARNGGNPTLVTPPEALPDAWVTGDQ